MKVATQYNVETENRVTPDPQLTTAETWRLMYVGRTSEVRTLHKALTKRAKRITGLKKKIARLETQLKRRK